MWKIASACIVLVMAIFAIGILLGLTNYYVSPISNSRYVAFWVVVMLPIVAAISSRLTARRPGFSLMLLAVLLLLDIALIQFANGRW
jgi:hypothetical protein